MSPSNYHCNMFHGTCLRSGFILYSVSDNLRWAIRCVVWTRLENIMFASNLHIVHIHIIDHTNELAHSISCIEQLNKYYVQCVSDNGLHPVTRLSCPAGNAITYFLTYIGLTNKLVPLKFCHLGWYRYFVWPMDYLLKRLTFVNRDKNGSPFRIDKNRI